MDHSCQVIYSVFLTCGHQALLYPKYLVFLHLYIYTCMCSIFRFLMYVITRKITSFSRFCNDIYIYIYFFIIFWLWQTVGKEHSIKCLLNKWINPPNLYFLMFLNDIQTQFAAKDTYTLYEQKFYELFLTGVVLWYLLFNSFPFALNSLKKNTGCDQLS